MGLLRFILALSVVIFHGGYFFDLKLVHGYPAVTVFLIISGFYMTMILNGKYESYWPFIKNRFLKIFPAYLVIIFICHLVNPINFAKLDAGGQVYFIFSNIFIFFSEWTSVLVLKNSELALAAMSMEPFKDARFTWNYLYIGPVWSLSVELMFYLMAPFLVKFGKNYHAKIFTVGALSFSYWIFLYVNNVHAIPWGYNLLLPNLIYFMLGSFSFWFFYNSMGSKILKPTKLVTGSAFLIVTLFCLSYSYLPDFFSKGIFGFRSHSAFMVLLFVILTPYVFEFTKRSKVDRFIGNLSYPIYTSHYLVLKHSPIEVPPILEIPAIIVISIMLYFLVMLPIEKGVRNKPKAKILQDV
jgi:peptidoglycan/LPS O-acetylase OafA/YrhL